MEQSKWLNLWIVLALGWLAFLPDLSRASDANDITRYFQSTQPLQRSAPTHTDLSAQQITSSFINGGFETGDFSGWTYGDNGLNALGPWQVCATSLPPPSPGLPPCGYFGNGAPQEGGFDAMNGFDGEAGYEAFLYQDIQVPVDGGTVSLWDRIQYDGLGIPSALPRTYEIQLQDGNQNLLAIVHHQEIALNEAAYTDLGWQKREFDVSAYSGQTLRVYIRLFVPETFTGPAQIEFDNFVVDRKKTPCTLKLKANYGADTFKADFEIGTTESATWNVWLAVQNETFALWSVPLPALDTPVTFPLAIPFFPPLGNFGVLTTLTVPDRGILCSDWQTVDTGTMLVPGPEQLPQLLRGLFEGYPGKVGR
jgi:hypothetical protein